MSINHNHDAGVQRYIEIDGEQIPVSEEVYRALKRPRWAEHKRNERAKRCRDENGFRCTKDCRTCKKARKGSFLSIDRFMEEGYDIPDMVDIAELVADKLLLEQLFAALCELEPAEKELISALFYQNRTERDYAAEVGVSHQAVGKRKKKVFNKLRKMMSTDSK